MRSSSRGRSTAIRSSAKLATTRTEFPRFVVAGGGDAVAVDAVGRYTDADGSVSVVSSCDVYTFTGGALTSISSYAEELDPPGWPGGEPRRSRAPFSVKQRSPFRKRFIRSRRQSRQTGPVYRATGLSPVVHSPRLRGLL